VESLDRFGVETLSGLDWPVVTPLMKFLSATHELIPLVLAVVLMVRCRRVAPVVMTTLAIVLGNHLDGMLKSWIGRPRPSLVDPHVHPLIAVPSDPSMPSGHALTAFACAAVLAPFAPRLRPWLYVYAGAVATVPGRALSVRRDRRSADRAGARPAAKRLPAIPACADRRPP
jgi:membrane-associated phospholipid phosphatase